MKKLSFMLMMLVLVLALAACGDKKEEDKSTDGKKDNEDVEITLPASFFEAEDDINELIAEAKQSEGINDVIKNEDGSLTYKMSKAKHEEMMSDMSDEVASSIEEMKTSEDFVSIKDITHNDKFTEFTMVVDKEAFENSFDGFAAFGLGLNGMMYQFLDGVDESDNKVKINYKDESTGEVFDSIIYPDDMEE